MSYGQPPPPPNAENDPHFQSGGVAIPMEMLAPLARWYQQLRPFAPLIMRMARVKYKIPPELDDAMEALAASGNPEALKRLADRGRQTYDLEQTGAGAYGLPGEDRYEVPPDEPGARVMTDDMAEQAYYLHTVKHMGLMQIAQHFADRGSPVSKATVARYVEDKRQDYEEEEEDRKNAFTRKLRIGALTVAAWFGSALGLHLLLNFLHLF